jgi:hypothetical protein
MTPAFGHACASFNLGRKLGLVVAFTAFGLVACASGIALLVAGSDDDSLSAFALAPLLSTGAQRAAPSADLSAVETALAIKGDRLSGPRPGVAVVDTSEPPATAVDNNSDRASAPDDVAVVAEPPAAAQAPVDPASPPVLVPPLPAALVASAPPTDAAAPSSAEQPAPPAAAPAKPRKTARREGRRGSQYQTMSSWPFGGHARQNPFRLFW